MSELPTAYTVILDLYDRGILDKDEARLLLVKNKYVSGETQPYQRQQGVLTKIVQDLKAEGQSKDEIAVFFANVIDSKYDA